MGEPNEASREQLVEMLKLKSERINIHENTIRMLRELVDELLKKIIFLTEIVGEPGDE